MARGEFLSARVESIAAGGAGVARFGGKTVFIALTAPGDLVKFRITEEKKNWAGGELLEILEPSTRRIEAKCAYYGLCGGCTLQHLDYESQIEAKSSILGNAFQRIGNIKAPPIKAVKSPAFEYRNRMKFHITGDVSGRAARPGFKERRSSRLVAVDDCPVADPGIRKALKEGDLLPPGILSRGSKSFNVFSQGKTFLREGAEERGKVSVPGRELEMDVNVFFQSNTALLEPLIRDLINTAQASDKKLPAADIYSGVGTFAAFLGGLFPEIDLVEENKTALALARENMPKSNKVNFHAITDTEWVKTMETKERPLGFIVLDPPRSGLPVPLAKWLAQKGPALAAYVSCDPATLARDSRLLVEGGYSLKELTMYDFYPQTAHIESLAVFSRESK